VLEIPDNKPARTQATPQPKIDVPRAPELPEDVLKEFPAPPAPLPTTAPIPDEPDEADDAGKDDKPAQ
jgi:hypothetical protein